ncbi:hypothetical protein LINPERPRIM_LOCUS2859 [Linum perenne]
MGFSCKSCGCGSCCINLPAMRNETYGSEILDMIHSLDWMSKFKDITACEFWFFPILHASHYSMFIVDIKRKCYQFFDSRSTDAFKSMWHTTGDRVVKYVTEYYDKCNSPIDFGKFKWEVIKGISQRKGSEFCGDYLLRMMIDWEGRVRTWMHTTWRCVEEIDRLREQLTLDIFSTLWNDQFRPILEAGLIHHTVSPSQIPLP